MLRPDAGCLAAREPDRWSRVWALGISFSLHGAALALLFLWHDASPPEPLAVFAVDLVYAAEVPGSSGNDLAVPLRSSQTPPGSQVGSARTKADLQQQPDGLARKSHSASVETSSDANSSSVQRVGNLTPLRAPAQKDIQGQKNPALQPSTEAALLAVPSKGAVEAARSIALVPHRKPRSVEGSDNLAPVDDRSLEEPVDRQPSPSRSADRMRAQDAALSEAEPSAVRQQPAAKGAILAALSATAAAGGSDPGDNIDSAPRHSGAGLSNAPPRYPHLARRRGQEGRVVLRVEVDADGAAAAVRIRRSSGHRLLDAAAIEAVRGWRFLPAKRAGTSVAGVLDVPVSFKITER